MPRKKAPTGYCNICNSVAPLTFDHVPPQGTVIPRSMELTSFVERMVSYAPTQVNIINTSESGKPVLSKPRISQNGVKFRSICADCNNRVLGQNYDKEIKRIAQIASKFVQVYSDRKIHIPPALSIEVKTHHLVRGIMGHLLSAIESPDINQPFPWYDQGFYADMRQYVLNENLPIPSSTEIYCWIFPYNLVTIIKGLGMVSRESGQFIIGDLLKFFPLAFYVVNTQDSNARLPFGSIKGGECTDPDCKINIQLPLNRIPPPNWPETPNEQFSTVFPDQASVIAAPKNNRQKS